MYTFDVTFAVVDEYGDTLDSGHIAEDLPLSEALEELMAISMLSSCARLQVTADTEDFEDASSLTVSNEINPSTGEEETRTIHFPEELTGATRLRIASLLGARWA
jgi:hypothetical protein